MKQSNGRRLLPEIADFHHCLKWGKLMINNGIHRLTTYKALLVVFAEMIKPNWHIRFNKKLCFWGYVWQVKNNLLSKTMPYKSHRYPKRLLILVKKDLRVPSNIDQNVTSRGRRHAKIKEVTTHRSAANVAKRHGARGYNGTAGNCREKERVKVPTGQGKRSSWAVKNQ